MLILMLTHTWKVFTGASCTRRNGSLAEICAPLFKNNGGKLVVDQRLGIRQFDAAEVKAVAIQTKLCCAEVKDQRQPGLANGANDCFSLSDGRGGGA